MRRETHGIIGATTGFIIAPATPVGVVVGIGLGLAIASLPDDIEKPLGLEHRKASHSIWAVMIVAAVAVFVVTWLGIELAYAGVAVGSYTAHIIADCLTISGVYWLAPANRSKLHLLPKPLRPGTNSTTDKLIAAAVGAWLLYRLSPDVIILFDDFFMPYLDVIWNMYKLS
jgi:membrane-bound metal-dependent hydrolase YbcI (DUF457 family)